MSLVFPGLGQVYNGHAARGLIWYLAIAAYGFGFMHWHSPWISLGVRGFIFAWSLVLLGHLLAGIEAAVSARRSPKRRPYQKWWCYLLIYALATLLTNLFFPFITDTFRVTLAVKPYTIPGGSMIPNLKPGDLALVDMRAYHSRPPGPFEPVILSYPDEADRDFLARIVAGPGDTVEIKEGRLLRNGQPAEGLYNDIIGDYEKTLVWPGHVFVMGDNVNNSRDSRYRGQVPISLVKGRIIGIVWPPGRVRDFPDPPSEPEQ
jgi:signal peptidase I